MDTLMFGKYAILNRKLTSADSYGYRLFHFLVSDEFKLICSTMLPAKRMQTLKAMWPILGRALGNILYKCLIDTVCNERRKRDPKIFQRQGYASLTGEELKSETDRVMGWAIASARKI